MTSDTSLTHEPMDLGEIYGKAIALIRRTPAVAIFIFLTLFAAAVLYGYGNMLYVSSQADIAASGGFTPGADKATQEAALKSMMGAFVPFVFIMVIFFFTITFTQVAATMAGWEAINDRPTSLGEVLTRAIRRPFWMSVIQTIFLLGILAMIALVAGIVSFLISGGNPARLSMIFGVVILVAVAYPVVATMFRMHKVVLESRGPWQGMIASIALVKGSWWRTFGVLLLLFVAMFGLQLIVGFGMGTMKMPAANMPDMSDPNAMAATLQQAKEAYTWGYILINGLLISLSLTFMYYLLTPMYVDLRARHGDFVHADGETGMEAWGSDESEG